MVQRLQCRNSDNYARRPKLARARVGQIILDHSASGIVERQERMLQKL